jgi:hypothetical protein
MAVPISPRKRRLLSRPAPHACPDINLSNYIYGPDPMGWSDWRRLRGGGVRSWLCWLGSAFMLSGPTQTEANWLKHQHMLDERRCHSWDGMTWCFCEGAA